MDFEEKQILGDFNFNKALLYHISRISKLISCYPVVTGDPAVQPVMAEQTREFILKSFLDATEVFESMLSPYIDDEFKKELVEKIETWKEKKYTDREIALDKYSLLLKLMDRLNLLLTRTTAGELK